MHEQVEALIERRREGEDVAAELAALGVSVKKVASGVVWRSGGVAKESAALEPHPHVLLIAGGHFATARAANPVA